jgi:urease accessory protein
MLEVHELVTGGRPTDRLVLPWELRRKSRLRATTAAGAVIGIFLPRGTTLLAGSLLRASDGQIILIEAALEDVSTIRAADPTLLARVAYHLGNRHIRTEIGAGYVRYRHDRAVDGLLRGLGVAVIPEEAPFEPERGMMERHDHDQDS